MSEHLSEPSEHQGSVDRLANLHEQLKASLVRCQAEKLDAIPRVCVALPTWEGDPTCRPDHISVWAGMCEDTPPHVTIYIPPLLGQQGRYLDIEPGEARSLALILVNMAKQIDMVIPDAEPDPA